MQLTYSKTLLDKADGVQKVTALAWTPNNGKLAAVTTDKVVHLFDDLGEKRDKFKTKAADQNGVASYTVRSMAFSPDSTRLAIAQSDNIVFIYRLGAAWDEKKSICNKFLQGSPVTSLAWPQDHHNEVVFGVAEGKVKLGMLKTNKTYTLYSHPDNSYVVSLAPSQDGNALLSGHLDGSVYKCTLPKQEGGQGPGSSKLLQHHCVPHAIAWGQSILIAGNSCKVVFYDVNGREQQVFDYSTDPEARDFSCCSFSPSGDVAVVGAFSRFYVYRLNSAKSTWEEAGMQQVEGFYTVSSVSWKPDGSQVVIGGLTGAVDTYDVCLKRVRHKGNFEFTYVSRSAVIVRTLSTGSRIVLKSVYGYEISKLDVYQERYLVGRTSDTVLFGDLVNCSLSEIPWAADGGEKFYFENEKVCLMHSGGEVVVVEYGSNEPLATVRTEQMSPYLLSVAWREARAGAGAAGVGAAPAVKLLAYLADLYTVRVLDLTNGGQLMQVAHETKIDWLELNAKGSHLLYRDKQHRLSLVDLSTQVRTTLLPYVQYCQWVPGSDVVVAQNRGALCVWYTVKAPDKMTSIPIKGEVQGIERSPGRTDVLVDEGLATATYTLDEALIDFQSALEELDFSRAIATMEPLPLTPETEAQWAQLAKVALEHELLAIAERCYAAVGDIAKARFLHKLVKMAAASPDGSLPPLVRARLAMLSQQWPVAESLLLAQGQVDDVIAAYQECHRWQDAIRVADQSGHPQADLLRQQYYQWLLQTAQEDRAGAVKEQEGDYKGAIGLYLKGGLPAKAAQVVLIHHAAVEPGVLDSICAALHKAGLQERAGDLYLHLGRQEEALAAYRKGHAYRKAVQLAKTCAPSTVIALEEEWGDWLASQKQMDAAINHYIEAGVTVKAIEAAIAARQFPKAAGIIDFLEPPQALPYFRRIAGHYEQAGQLDEAEKYWVRASLPLEAVEMYCRAGKWEAAQKVARGYLPQAELQRFYSRRAREFEAAQQWKDAEKAYLAAGEVDMAVNMYKKNKMWENMLRLVQQHRKEGLPQAHLLVAQALQGEGAFREAERHFCDAKEWKAAVAMYRTQCAWEDALRVAKVYGGLGAANQVAYAWAVELGGSEGAVLLQRLGLADGAVEYAMEVGAFAHAFQLAEGAAKEKLPDVHLKYAMFLEDAGRFAEAEQEFLNAGKPQEAIDMHTHNQDWEAAMRVAEQYDPPAVQNIFMMQASQLAEAQQYPLAEALYLRAKRPDAALDMYRNAGQWQQALRIAEAYLPGSVAAISREMAQHMQGGGPNVAGSGLDQVVAKARAFEKGNDWARAIETYLSVTAQDSANTDALQRTYMQAANLILAHQRHRAQALIPQVAQRLQAIGRAQAAAEVLEAIDDIKGAVSVLCASNMFDQARGLAAGNPALLATVEGAQTQQQVSNQDAEGLAARGNAGQAVELYAAQGNWDRAHALAAQAGPEMAASYAARHAQVLLRQHDFMAAASVLAQHGVSPDPSHLQLYTDLTLELLGCSQAARSAEGEAHLRDALYKLWQQMQTSPAVRKQDTEDMQRLFWAAHLTAAAGTAAGAGLHLQAARQLTALLRFIGIIPQDRAFYEAGMAWKAAGQAGMAFVMLNRYLDLADAMEEGGEVLENADFADTDVPYDVRLPDSPYLDAAAREEVRNYVLELSMDQTVSQALVTKSCEHCGADTYEANLTCHSCKHVWDTCAVSGYPVGPHERVVSRSNLPARREDWNAWVQKFGTDPVTGAAATPLY